MGPTGELRFRVAERFGSSCCSLLGAGDVRTAHLAWARIRSSTVEGRQRFAYIHLFELLWPQLCSALDSS